MRTWYRLAVLILTAALCLGAARAEEANAPQGRMILGGAPEDPSVQIITMVGTPLESSIPILFLSPDDSPDTLELPSTYPCVIGRFGYACPVEWERTSLSMEPGLRSVLGTLYPEEGYTLSPELSPEVRYPVYVTGGSPPAETLSALRLDYAEQEVLPLGGDPAELHLNNYSAHCLAPNPSEYFSAPIVWDYDGLTLSRPGIYSITGTPELPDGFQPPEEFVPWTVKVGVVSTEYIDLSAAFFSDGGGLDCKFLYRPEDLNTVGVDYSVDGGAWTADPAVTVGGHRTGHYFYCRADSITFYLSQLEPGTDYRFRVTYDDDQVSNVLRLRLEDAVTEMAVSGIGGDRDGGDWGGVTLPDFSQGSRPSRPSRPAESPSVPEEAPAPEEPPLPTEETPAVPQPLPSAEEGLAVVLPIVSEEPPAGNGALSPPVQPAPPDAAAEPPVSPPDSGTETVTQDLTALSGARLRLLTEQGKTVLFEKQGVSMELSSAFLKELGLGDEDLLEVTLEQPEPNAFQVSILSRGQSVDALPETAIRIPVEAPSGPLECVDASGVPVSETVYDAETGTAACTIRATGAYRLISPAGTEEPPVPSPRSSAPRWAGFGAAAAVIAAALVPAWRKRHG